MISVTISGRVGADAEMRQAGSTDVLSFRVASNDYRKKEKVTDWISVSFFGSRAASIAQYVTKGSSVVVRGKAFARTYQDRAGQTVAALEVEASDVELLGGKPDGEQPRRPAQPQRSGTQRAPASGGADYGGGDYSGAGAPMDDIPFIAPCADWTRP